MNFINPHTLSLYASIIRDARPCDLYKQRSLYLFPLSSAYFTWN